MSEATAKALKDARELVSERTRVAEDEKRACLKRVADGLPAAIDGIAKKTATAQPEVTKTLGVEGVKTLRSELAAVADELAREIEDAARTIKWSRYDEPSEWSSTSARDVHSGMFDFFVGIRANRVAKVFRRHGYDVQDMGRGQSLIHPHSFYEEKWFKDVASAINDLNDASRQLAKVKKADDDDIVADIWGDS